MRRKPLGSVCKGVEFKEICGPWGGTESMKKTSALKVGELQEEEFCVTW